MSQSRLNNAFFSISWYMMVELYMVCMVLVPFPLIFIRSLPRCFKAPVSGLLDTAIFEFDLIWLGPLELSCLPNTEGCISKIERWAHHISIDDTAAKIPAYPVNWLFTFQTAAGSIREQRDVSVWRIWRSLNWVTLIKLYIALLYAGVSKRQSTFSCGFIPFNK